MKLQPMRKWAPIFLTLCCNAHAAPADWVMVYDAPDQTMHYDKANVQPYEGRIFVRSRVTFKQEMKQDDGRVFRFTVLGSFISCKDRTDSIEGVSNFAEDRTLVSKKFPKITQRIRTGDPFEKVVLSVCDRGNLGPANPALYPVLPEQKSRYDAK